MEANAARMIPSHWNYCLSGHQMAMSQMIARIGTVCNCRDYGMKDHWNTLIMPTRMRKLMI
eukprot:12936557-Prorocentrum_lima.AAC.1